MKKLLQLLIIFMIFLVSFSEEVNGQAAVVSLQPSRTELFAGEEFTVIVWVEVGSKGVSSVDIRIAFDNKTFKGLEIIRGGVLGDNVIELFKEIDNEKGTIMYVAARRDKPTAPTTKTQLITIKFKVAEEPKDGTYNFEIIYAALSDENIQDIKPISKLNSTVTVFSRVETITQTTIEKTTMQETTSEKDERTTPPRTTVTTFTTREGSGLIYGGVPGPNMIIIPILIALTIFFTSLLVYGIIRYTSPVCRGCGLRNNRDARFCRRCGAKLR